VCIEPKTNGIPLVSVAEHDLCSSEPTRILMRQMMSAFAQCEKSMIVAKLRGAPADEGKDGLL
jgi:DNA invertase Pin-like site-specific DNA recombinase